MDLLHSFDQLKVLNLSGNHLLNTSLTLLDSVGSLEVSATEFQIILSLYKHESSLAKNVQTEMVRGEPQLHKIAFNIHRVREREN